MTRRVKSARANGSLGGKQGSRNLNEDQREARARNAGLTTLSTYGRDYYSFLGQRQKARKKPVEIPIQSKVSVAARRIAAMSFKGVR